MQIKSIVAGAAIALIAGVGSVSADEPYVPDTAGATGAPFALLEGLATDQMSALELASTRGAGWVMEVLKPNYEDAGASVKKAYSLLISSQALRTDVTTKVTVY